MKSQQGFIVFAGAAWLAAAALTGGFVAAVESGEKDTATAQGQSTLVLAGAPAAPLAQESPAVQQTTYVGTSYRNGGHYGDKNSDEKMESIDP